MPRLNRCCNFRNWTSPSPFFSALFLLVFCFLAFFPFSLFPLQRAGERPSRATGAGRRRPPTRARVRPRAADQVRAATPARRLFPKLHRQGSGRRWGSHSGPIPLRPAPSPRRPLRWRRPRAGGSRRPWSASRRSRAFGRPTPSPLSISEGGRLRKYALSGRVRVASPNAAGRAPAPPSGPRVDSVTAALLLSKKQEIGRSRQIITPAALPPRPPPAPVKNGRGWKTEPYVLDGTILGVTGGKLTVTVAKRVEE